LEAENQKKMAENLSFGPTTVGTADLIEEEIRGRVYGPSGALEKGIVEEWDWYFERPQYIEEHWKEWIAS
ncbi:MAG: hypothetical protein ABIH23_16655, partial [bacterium]